MNNALSSLLVFFLLISLISCGAENSSSSTDQSIELESSSDETQTVWTDTMKNTTDLFLFYSEKCEEMATDPSIEFVDAQDIVDEAFSDKYNRADVESAFEWYISKVLLVQKE